MRRRLRRCWNTKLLERDIPGVGVVPVTGIPFGRWSVAAKTLTEKGQSIFFAEPAEQGGYEVVKELNGRRDTPHYQVGDTVYLDDKAFLIEQITDIHGSAARSYAALSRHYDGTAGNF